MRTFLQADKHPEQKRSTVSRDSRNTEDWWGFTHHKRQTAASSASLSIYPNVLMPLKRHTLP